MTVFGKHSVICFGRNEGLKNLHTTKWFKDPDCSYFVKQSSFWQPDIRQEALQPGSKKKKIKQDHLRRNVAPDQTIILDRQIFIDHRSLSSIGQNILMILHPLPLFNLSCSLEIIWMFSIHHLFVFLPFCLFLFVFLP